MRRREFLHTAGGAITTAVLAGRQAGRGQSDIHARRFSIRGEQFELDGTRMVLRSGSMHYPRVPRPYWRDRMQKLRAMGLNAVCTYVFWNLHEPRPGEFDFRGNLDLAAYLREAQRAGLWVILRPGPYVCTEWDFGGFPAWLLRPPAVRVRSSDPAFLAASQRYLRAVGREVAGLQVHHGGPIVLVQVENEYGSYGQDAQYLHAIREQMGEAGFEVPFFTSNGPGEAMLAHGSLPGVTSVINFGDGDDPAAAFATLAKFRPGQVRMCGEYWDGWFDHWGERHHTTPPEASARGLNWMLSQGISCNLYMAHGGTSFGFMAGANFGRRYQPDTTSYDYDAPLDEAGAPRPKFFALRAVMKQHLAPGEHLPPLPPPLPRRTIAPFPLAEFAPLEFAAHSGRETPTRTEHPLPMEALGQAYGLIWYRTEVAESGEGELEPLQLRDYGRAYQGGRLLGTWDRSRGTGALRVNLDASAPLDLVVENMGRINFGPKLPDNQQGITSKVLWKGKELLGWNIAPLPLDHPERTPYSRQPGHGPGFYRGTFAGGSPADCFLDMRGWSKGYVWVNGHNLGRYWSRGPQQCLFLPGCWQQPAANQVIVFAWDPPAAPRLQGLKEAVYSVAEETGETR